MESGGDLRTVTGYHRLAKAVMGQVVVFNRKRATEVDCITVKNFVEDQIETHSEVMNLLTEFEKKLITELTLIKVTGKNEAKVPTLLTKGFKASIHRL